MLKKLKSYFPTAIATNIPPTFEEKNHYWFKDEENNPFWLGVPKSDINSEQLELLSTLYELETLDYSATIRGAAKHWHDFLFNDAILPASHDTGLRFIQFHIGKFDQGFKGVEEGIKEFFHNCLAFFWLDKSNGIIIEEKSEVSYTEDDIQSIAVTLESDFYMKAFFYIGKFRNGPDSLRESFFLERDIFVEAMQVLSKERIYSFEKIFPNLIANALPKVPGTILKNDVTEMLKEDSELRQTMEVFLENNSNTSLAAKKLFVHRNTLQYRLDRFTEKTGINLKNFNSAFTVYLACLLARKKV